MAGVLAVVADLKLGGGRGRRPQLAAVAVLVGSGRGAVVVDLVVAELVLAVAVVAVLLPAPMPGSR